MGSYPFRYKLTLQYNGTNFYGWQYQPSHRTVQGELNKALSKIFKHRVTTMGAARTDTGVHAKAQIVGFRAPCEFKGRMAEALNQQLPKDIVVLKATQVSASFHPQKNSVAKEYRYNIFNRAFRPVLEKEWACWVKLPLDFVSMKEASKGFLGRHNFSQYAGPSSKGLSPICTIHRISFQKKGPLIVITIKADRFLHNMMRRLVGRLVQKGLGKKLPFSPKTMGPQGLTLLKVFYK